MNFNSTPIYNAHQSQFLQAMQRESKTITDYWTGQNYSVLFKKNQNTNQNNNNITIYYSANEPIKEGDLLCYGGKVFLTLNAETIENDVYRRSDCLETTMLLDTYSNRKELQIPCYSYDLLNVNPNTGSIINLVNGTIELMTQHCSYSDDITIDSRFTGMGGVYKIVNLYYKLGILHIFVQRYLEGEPTTYTLKIAGESQYPAQSKTQLKAIASRTEGPVDNATIRWTSSDNTIASINAENKITFHEKGTVTVSALWVEHNIADETTIEITDPLTTTKICEITGEPELIYGEKEIYTAIFYDDNDVIDDNIEPIWRLELLPIQEKKVKIVAVSGKTVTIFAEETDEIVKTYFKLHLSDASGDYGTFKSIKIGNWFSRSKPITE